MIIFGIDPGVSGAISILENKKVIEIFDMPTMISLSNINTPNRY